MNSRLLGSILIVTTLIVAVDGIRTTVTGSEALTDPLSGLAYTLWGVGGICGILGMIRSNALGSNAVARALGFLPLLGFATFVLGNGLAVIGLIEVGTPLTAALATIGWITMLAGMLVVGILTIAAKTWTGWRRFVPLLTVAMLPIGFFGQALGALEIIGGVLAFSPWVLLGYVIAAAEPRAFQQELVRS